MRIKFNNLCEIIFIEKVIAEEMAGISDLLCLQNNLQATNNFDSSDLNLEKYKKFRNGSLYLAAVTSNLISFTIGFGFLAIHKYTKYEEYYLSYLMLHIGSAIGALCAGAIVGKIGRKRTLLLATCPMFTSFLIFAFSNPIDVQELAQFLNGFGGGAAFTVIPIYVAEIATDQNRGVLVSLLPLFSGVGLLVANRIWSYFSIQSYFLFGAAQLLIFFLIFFLWNPESPQYLASTDDKQRLKASLKQLRKRSNQEIQQEIDSINRTFQEQNKRAFFYQKSFWRGIAISLSVIFLFHISNYHLFRSLPLKVLYWEVENKIYSFVILFFNLVFCVFVALLNRRIVLCISAAISSFSIVMLILVSFLTNYHHGTINTIFIYLAFFGLTIGIGLLQPLLFMLMGEMFSYNLKPVACSLIVMIDYIAAAITTPVADFLFHCLTRIAMVFLTFLLTASSASTIIYLALVTKYWSAKN